MLIKGGELSIKMAENKRHGGKREGAGRPPAEDKRISRSIKFSDVEWEIVKQKADAAGKTISDYIRMKAL